MLISADRLLNTSILSLHVGGEIARVAEAIVDPDKLKIIALRLEGPLVGREFGEYLMMEKIREYSQMGMVIDSSDDLNEADEVIRLQKVLELKFDLNGLRVITKKGEKLGKVVGFTVAVGSWEVMQLLVQRPLVKALIDPELLIPRSQIVEVNDTQVIVKNAKEKSPSRAVVAEAAQDFIPNFVNPFRNPEFAPKEIDD